MKKTVLIVIAVLLALILAALIFLAAKGFGQEETQPTTVTTQPTTQTPTTEPTTLPTGYRPLRQVVGELERLEPFTFTFLGYSIACLGH